ncbi:MAG: hypothetical protein WAM28_08300, partial [Chlamydiales bacterium]
EGELKVPSHLLVESSDYFYAALTSPFKEKGEREFDFRKLNEHFPHLKESIGVLFLDRPFDSKPDEVFWGTLELAEYLGFKKERIIKDGILKKCSQIDNAELRDSISILFSHYFNYEERYHTTIQDCLEKVSNFYLKNDKRFKSQNKLIQVCADFMLKAQLKKANEYPKYFIFFYLGKFYSKIGYKKMAFECFQQVKSFIPPNTNRGGYVRSLNSLLKKLIESFCLNSSYFTAADILKYIDEIPSDYNKLLSLSCFIELYEGHTEATLQEAEKRLEAFSDWKKTVEEIRKELETIRSSL